MLYPIRHLGFNFTIENNCANIGILAICNFTYEINRLNLERNCSEYVMCVEKVW